MAAALIPPGNVKIVDTDVVHTRERQRSIYGVEGQNYLSTGRQERSLMFDQTKRQIEEYTPPNKNKNKDVDDK